MGYTDPDKAAAYAREWRKKHAAKVSADDLKRRSSPEAKAIAAARAQKWRKENPERHLANVLAWQKANPDKSREYAARAARNQAERLKTDPEFAEKRRASSRNWHRAKRAKDPGHYRNSALKYAYGLTVEQYDAMVLTQGGVCAICRADRPGGKGRWHVDHCHDSGKIRELLCHSCNTGLGAFRDNLTLLQAAVAYLERHKVGLTTP